MNAKAQALTFIRDSVLEFVVAIHRSPKNMTSQFKHQALGAINMAAALKVIDSAHADSADQLIKAAAAWRSVCNFPNMHEWQASLTEAQKTFRSIWG